MYPIYQTPLSWEGQIHSSNLMIDVFQISFETFLRPTLFPGRHQDVEWVNFGRWLKPPASFNLRILSFKEAGEIRISMKTYFPAKECSSQSIDLPREAHLDLSYAMISKEAISRNKRGSYKECLSEIGRPEFFLCCKYSRREYWTNITHMTSLKVLGISLIDGIAISKFVLHDFNRVQ